MNIQVKYQPTHYILDGEWECQHESTHLESFTTDYMTFEGADQFETDINVCDSCEAWQYLGSEEWQE